MAIKAVNPNWLYAVKRRDFLAATSALFCPLPGPAIAAEFPVRFRKPNPCDTLTAKIEPGNDEFAVEKRAADLTRQIEERFARRTLPGLESVGDVRRAGFFVLPGDRVRYEIASSDKNGLAYRVGHWKLDGGVVRLLDQSIATTQEPFFKNVTADLFRGCEAFHRQMLFGVPYWRSRLDSASGISVFGNNGIAVGDADGDGWDEVYVCQPGGLPNRLFHRQQDATWQDVTEQSGVGVLDDTASALFLDLRNSGRQDLIVLTTIAPLLFLNEGGGKFRHVPDAFRFATPPQGTFAGMAAADYDRDGKLDLYVCTYLYFQSEDQYRYPVPYHDAQNGPPNFLFRNRLNADGSGWFEDVTAATGLNENNNRYSFAPAWCDYNGDGWPDLYVANDFGRNNLYRNQGGKFRDVAAEAGVEDIGPGMSTAWFDYDGDGWPDLYVANMWTPSGGRVIGDPSFGPIKDGASAEAYRRHTKGNSLYRNRGDGTFEETGPAEGVEMGRWAWAADGIDWDLDGVPEILVTTGMVTHDPAKDLGSFFWRQVVARSPADKKPAPAYENGWNCLNQLIREDYSWNGNEPNVFYVRKDGRYRDYSGVSGLDLAADSRAFAVTDFDGDGHPDLFLKNRLAPQVVALRNDSVVKRQPFVIELRGVKSNRDAIGARVEVESESGRTVQWLTAGSAYISQHTKRLHFGLQQSPARVVRVRWPSGAEQEFRDLSAGYRYRLTEDSSEVERFPLLAQQKPSPAEPQLKPINDLVFEPTWLIEPVPLPEQAKRAGFLCLVDSDVPTIPSDVPFDMVDLRTSPPDRAAAFALFRRYLFDYRAGLRLPLLLLVDEQSLVHKVYPSIPDTAVLRGDLQRMRQPDRDRLALPFAGRYYSRPGRNYFRLGAAFFWAGYPDQALAYLREVVRRDPANFKAQLAIGQIHLEAGRNEEAVQYLKTAASLNPASPELWNNLGGVEMAREDYAAALRNFQKALELNPDLPFALVNAGQAHSRLGNQGAAEKMFRRALELDPNDADAANYLGLLLARQGKTEEAAVLLKRAIAARRDHSGAINNLGVLYVQMGKTDDAIAAFRYGIEVAPDYDTLYFNLARVYVDMGDVPKARSTLEALLQRKPTNAAARKALTQLGER